MLRSQRLGWRGALCLALALGLQTAAVGTARADGGWYGQRHYYRHGHRNYGHHRGDSDLAVGLAIVVGGLVVGTLLAHSLAEPPPAYPLRATAAEPLRLGNCKPTTGRQIINGRWALLRGTWCTDQYGRGYILDDSVRFVRYLG